MKYLLYYNVNSDFVSDQVEAGGDGSKVVSVVDGVAWTNDIEKIHFNPHDETVLTQQVTINYKTNTGVILAPSGTVSVDYISGKKTKIVLTPPNISGYVPTVSMKKITVPTQNTVNFIYETPKDRTIPLTFEILTDGTVFWKLTNAGAGATARTITYSKNGGEWTNIYPTTAGTPIEVASGDVIQFKGFSNRYGNYYWGIKSNIFGSTCQFKAKGNIMSLINGDNFADLITLSSSYTFYSLFNGCTGLTDASDLQLPATTLADDCYANMFSGCTSVTTAPALPATTLVNYCYQNMFRGRTSVTTAPELPATTLANYCYNAMFYNCTSLTTAHELPATTLVEYCCGEMFYNCTSLTEAPELPATTLVSYCYYNMFYNCTSLNYIKCLATDISASWCINSWVNNVASSGTFVKNPNMSSWTTGTSGIPSNWTVQDAS